MAFFTKNTQQESGDQNPLISSVLLNSQEAIVLLQAINQATFKGEYARNVVKLIEKLETIASLED